MLPPATEKVWNYLREQPALTGFVLTGGSALSLLIRHRLSEDLDFVFLEPHLPRPRLARFCEQATAAGFHFTPNDDEAAVEDFAQGGMELNDYQQDFLVNNTVKVSFFVPDEGQRRTFAPSAEPRPRVATLNELFRSKAFVSAIRSKTRDWLDLYLLMREHGFTIFDYRNAFEEAGHVRQCDTGLTRLCSGIPQGGDEGYAHLLSNPPSLEDMKNFFIAQREMLEIGLAAQAKRKSAS